MYNTAQPGHSSTADSPLGGGAGGTITDPRRRRDRPAADNADRRPLDVVGRHHHRPVVCGHVLRELIAEREPGGRAAPGDTKMLN